MNEPRKRIGFASPVAIVLSLCLILGTSWWLFALANPGSTATNESVTHPSDAARQDGGQPDEINRDHSRQSFPVSINPGPETPRISFEVQGEHGTSQATAACSTCHTTRAPNASNKQSSDLNEFHQGLTFSHHNLSCLSCHNPQDYNTLRLADGTPVEYPDVMRLCAQCHGTQTRDFEHGAHGGMTGYWDLSRGPRRRNNCVDCHHAHTPQFPKMRPTFKPRDRFLESAESHDDTLEHGSTVHE